MYDQWKTAKAVPIGLCPDARPLTGALNNTSKLDVDYWIVKPADIPACTWVCICKEYSMCAVYYYASLPASPEGDLGFVPHDDMRVEDIGDVLYIKLVGGQIHANLPKRYRTGGAGYITACITLP